MTILSISIACCLFNSTEAQKNISDTSRPGQKDLVDVVYVIIKKNLSTRDRQEVKTKKSRPSIGPILEYTLSTGLTLGLAASVSFFSDTSEDTKSSLILAAVKFTQKSQFLFPVQSSFWTKEKLI